MSDFDAIALAKKAGARTEHWATRLFPVAQVLMTPEELQQFTVLVATAEREACLKLCDVEIERATDRFESARDPHDAGHGFGAIACRDAIQARGLK